MSKIIEAVNYAISIAVDDSHGYQWGGWGPDYDCGHLIIMAWEHAGVHVRSAGATYTGNMRPSFLACGFDDVTGSVNLASGAGMQIGDVLVNQANHAALYIGNGRIVQARSNLDGIAGDSSGQEIRTQSYYNYPWDCVLRFRENGAPSGNAVNIEPIQTEPQSAPVSVVDENGYYTVRAGDSLWAIAARELGDGARYREIMTENGLSSTILHIGDKLKIPGKGSSAEAPEEATEDPEQTAADNAQPGNELDDGYYIVKKGDSLWAIANRYLGNGLRWREIQQINGLNTIIIHPGQRLKLPAE